VETLGVDYMMRSDAAYPTFREAGVSFVCRYLCPPGYSAKLLTSDEAQAISAAGLGIVSVWETNPTFAGYFTRDRGASDAVIARQVAQAVGQPAGRPIYFTVDMNLPADQYAALDAYLNGLLAVTSEYPAGIYGSYYVCRKVADRVSWLWQTYAWSGGQLHPGVQLYQYSNGVQLGGVSTDLDRAFTDPGWWRPGGEPVNPVPAPVGGVSHVPLTKNGDKGVNVAIIQTLLNVAGFGPLTIDGVFGSNTLNAVRAFQQKAGLTADGVVGSNTWDALSKVKPPPPDCSALEAEVKQLEGQLAAVNQKLQQIKAIVDS